MSPVNPFTRVEKDSLTTCSPLVWVFVLWTFVISWLHANSIQKLLMGCLVHSAGVIRKVFIAVNNSIVSFPLIPGAWKHGRMRT